MHSKRKKLQKIQTTSKIIQSIVEINKKPTIFIEDYQGENLDDKIAIFASLSIAVSDSMQFHLLPKTAHSQEKSVSSRSPEYNLKIPIAIKNKHINNFNFQTKAAADPLPSYHLVQVVFKNKSSKLIKEKFYVKQRRVSSYTTTPINIMPALEAVCGEFYLFLAPPGYISKTCALVDDQRQYVGVSSKALDGFTSTMEDPLKKADITIPYLKNMDQPKKNIESIFKNKNEKLVKLIKLSQKLQHEQQNVNVLSNDTILDQEEQITVCDMKAFIMIMGLAICLVLAYLLMEDDLHRGNMSKDGKHIDFDMSLWCILSKFKEMFWGFRVPDENSKRFIITEQDILHFPDLTDDKPFYWPTIAAPFFPEIMYSLLNYFHIDLSKNAFLKFDNEIHKLLKFDEAFVYVKYLMLLKFILTDENVLNTETNSDDFFKESKFFPNTNASGVFIERSSVHVSAEISVMLNSIYRNLAELHLPRQYKLEEKSLVDVIAETIAKRQCQFQEILVNMPQFKDFMWHYGDLAYETIKADFIFKNEALHKKIAGIDANIAALNKEDVSLKTQLQFKRHSYENLIINLENIAVSYQKIKKLVNKNSVFVIDDEINSLMENKPAF